MLRDLTEEAAAKAAVEPAVDPSVEAAVQPALRPAIEPAAIVPALGPAAPIGAEPHTLTVGEPVDTNRAVVAVVGLGYVGLPTAIALRGAGFRIIGIDSSARRLRAIAAGEVELLQSEREGLNQYLAGDGFVLTDSGRAIDAADLVVICAPTPLDEERRPDARALQAACASVVRHAHPEQTIVLTSTTYVGCTRELLVQPLAERGLHVGEDVFVAFAPERIDPGVEEHSQMRTPRVVGGVTEACFRHAAEVLSHTCDRVQRVSSPEAAEMAKLYENTFRAVNIALAFELAEACQSYGLDVCEVTEGAASKPYGFLAHRPSAGVGGHCIAVDPHYLAAPLRERERPAILAEAALRKIAGRPRHVVSRAQEMLDEAGGSLSGARVLIVGASYKPGIADTHQSPAHEIARLLLREGAEVEYHDPLVASIRVGDRTLRSVTPDPRVDASGFGPEDYDLTIVVTVHPEHDYGWLQRCPAVLDCTYETRAGRRWDVP